MIIGKCPVCGEDMRVGSDMTNADRIRSMTDEELGKLLNEFGHCPLSRIEDDCRSYDRCRDCWIDWLKEDAEEDDND